MKRRSVLLSGVALSGTALANDSAAAKTECNT